MIHRGGILMAILEKRKKKPNQNIAIKMKGSQNETEP